MNTLVIDRHKYPNEEAFEAEVGHAVCMLARLGYIMTFRYEDCGNYVIEYDNDDVSLGGKYPYWLDSEEAEVLL